MEMLDYMTRGKFKSFVAFSMGNDYRISFAIGCTVLIAECDDMSSQLRKKAAIRRDNCDGKCIDVLS